MISAFFDFDGTLYTGHIWRDLVGHHWRAKRHRRWVVAYLARNMAPIPLYRLGLIDRASYFRTWGETMAWLLRGWPIEEGQDLFDRLTDKLILPNLRRETLDRLRDHQAKGHLVGLVSGTFAPWLATVASRLEVPHAIGTPLETQEGRYTGRIIPPLCQNHDKLLRIQQYATGQGIEIDWAASYAYGDRLSDIPLLAQVGHPVAVSPEPDLLAHAQAAGWPVL